MVEMIDDGVEVYCLPDNAKCMADEEKRSPLNIELCPMGCETCSGNCFYYDEE